MVGVWAVTAGAAAAQPPATQPAAAAPATRPTTPAASPTQALPQGAKVAVVRVEGMIYDYTVDYLKERIDAALNDGCSVVVIELDTPGGVVTSAIEISRYLKTIPAYTIAWVDGSAYSAGTMIAAACDHIVMAPHSSMGDSAPVSLTGELAPTERAKALSPVLESYASSAAENGYDYTLFHAMCALGVEVYEVRHKATGEVRFVNQVDYAVMVDGQSLSDANKTHADQPVELRVLKPGLEEATDADRGQWELVKQVHDGNTLLTVGTQKAEDLRLSSGVVRNEGELRQHTKASSVTSYRASWGSSIAWWMSRPWVRGILMLVLLITLYIELQAPGIGVAGTIALLCLIGLVAPPIVVGLMAWWHLLLLLVGILLVIAEFTVIPGFGIAGISGLLMTFVALVLSAVPRGQGVGGATFLPAPEMWDRLIQSAVFMLLALIGGIAGIATLTRYFGDIPVFNKLVLAAGDAPGVDPAVAAAVSGDEVLGSGAVAVGATGRVAAGGLHPGGRAQIGDAVVDVVSTGGFIPAGKKVRVTEIAGNRIVVDTV